MERRIDEVRCWFLRCAYCEHEGIVEVTLRQLRRANIKCTECGRAVDRK